MPNTTNYNWATPADTDLVKDGAAAIRTLGSSIDTTTKNLNPQTTTGALAYRSATANVNTALPIGTANQVLRVNSGGTAPEWATTADQTPLTTKGDLFGFDTADARIPIGTNGHILTADSTQSLGLKWAAPAAGGGMTLLSTTTLSGSSTTISTIDQTYLQLYIVLKNINVDVSTNAYVQIEPNATTNLTAYSMQIATGGTISTQGDATGTLPLSSDIYQAANTNNSFAIQIFNYAATDSFKPFQIAGSYVVNAGTNASINASGNFRSNTALSSLKVVPGGATAVFNGGTVLVYGVK